MIYKIDYEIYKEEFEAHREEYKNYPEYEKIKSIHCCEIGCFDGPQESIYITSDDSLFQKALEVAIFCKNYIFASCTSYDSISLYKNDEEIDDFDSDSGIFRHLLGEDFTDKWEK